MTYFVNKINIFLLIIETSLAQLLVIEEQVNMTIIQNITKNYHIIHQGESMFLDEVEDCQSNLWFKIGKNKPLRTKRIFANSSSSGIYYCKPLGPTPKSMLHHHILVIDSPSEITINNPPLIDKHWSNVTCNCSASLKSYNFIITINLLFGDIFIYTETIDSYKFKTTLMTITSTQEINKSQLHMNGTVTCLWLIGERTNVDVKWMELARATTHSEIMIPAVAAYADYTTVSPERTIKCNAHATPPVFRCHWKNRQSVNFITDETGCVLRIFNTGRFVFTCTAFNLIGGKLYNASWTGELTVLSEGDDHEQEIDEDVYQIKEVDKEASMHRVLKRINSIGIKAGCATKVTDRMLDNVIIVLYFILL